MRKDTTHRAYHLSLWLNPKEFERMSSDLRNSQVLWLYSAVRLIQLRASQITHKQHILAIGSASNREHWYRDAQLQSASNQIKEVTGLEEQEEQKEQEKEAQPLPTSNDSVVGRLVGEVGHIGRWAINEGHTKAGNQFT
jgi:hypothetical protein